MRERIQTMTEEQFAEFIKQDKWISNIANPVTCCTKEGNFSHYRTCTYPVEYVITEDMISRAKVLFQQRHDETLAGIKKGELVFRTMGGDYSPRFEGDVCNHRIRGYFKSTDGRTWFAELTRPSEISEKRFGPWFNYDFAHEVVDGEAVYGNRPEFPLIDHGSYKLPDRGIKKPFSLQNVLDDINERFGCCYTSIRLVRLFAFYDEWVCEC